MFKNLLITVMAIAFTAVSSANAGTAPSEKKNTPSTPKTAVSEKPAPVSKYRGKMELRGEQMDFGIMPQGAKVGHIFWLKNVGLDTLEIMDIKPG